MNRRDFLRPRHLARSTLGMMDALGELTNIDLELDGPALEFALLAFRRLAMATAFEFFIPFGTDQATEAAEEALGEVDRLEDQMTIYRDKSEVSQLNQQAFQNPMRVERHLFDLFLLANTIHQATEGAFDITTGALSKAWGFFRRRGQIPSLQERKQVMAKVGMNHLILDQGERTVRFLREGLEINLGSIGKGYALDRAALIIREGWGIRHALLHGGHSSVFALGSEPGGSKGWPIGLRHPWDPEKRLAIIHLRNRGLATSAVTFQHLEHEGKKLGHILDPRTGWPAQGIASATAIAPTAALADALATAFFIMGLEWTREFCKANSQIGAILLAEGDGSKPVVFGLDANEVHFQSGFAPSTGHQ